MEIESSTQTHERHGKSVLIVDTDPGVRWALEKGLTHSGYGTQTAASVERAMHVVNNEDVAVVLLEILPEAGFTFEVLSNIAHSSRFPKVVCSGVDSAPQTVIECMRRGAVDFLLKPFGLGEVRTAVSRALAASREEDAGRGAASGGGDEDGSLIVGMSESVQELRSLVKLVAQTDLNCLIRGESGVGKDVVAREIHRVSSRRDQPFVKVNCSALPEQLLESELFGFEKGAFTGAVSSKPGRFSLADRGIIFLDEIGDMHANVQAKLLQVIEHKEFTKLGGREAMKVDVQIIAATNADLEQKCKQGEFRRDLFFRLNEVAIWVPPLSARTEDIALLVRHFLQKYKHFSDKMTSREISEAITVLSKRAWPGNIRELESTVKRWLVLGKQGLEQLRTGTRPTLEAGPRGVEADRDAQEDGEDESTPEAILEALEENQWNRRKAAEVLGMSYQALRRRIDKYNLKQRK